MRMVDRVAGHTESVLVTGETGTGKELIARTIHQSSHRRSRPWVDINCAALPENLVESELFGYEKGAFSGADSPSRACSNSPTKARFSSMKSANCNFRLRSSCCACSMDSRSTAWAAIAKSKSTSASSPPPIRILKPRQGRAASARISFIVSASSSLRVPPLRERPEDIVALAEHFLSLKAPGSFFCSRAVSALLSHSWPGNVRELRNLIARIAMESRAPRSMTSQITDAMSGSPVAQRQSASMPVGNLDSMEEQMIIRASSAPAVIAAGRRTTRNLTPHPQPQAEGIQHQLQSRRQRERPGIYQSRAAEVLSRTHPARSCVEKPARRGTRVQGVNLSTGGLGIDGLKEPMKFTGLLDVSFPLPDSETTFRAKARIVWFGGEGRVGLRFAVIDPALFEQLQHWTNNKMKDEGWELPAELSRLDQNTTSFASLQWFPPHTSE